MSSTLGKLRSSSRTSSFNAMMIKGSPLVAVIWALMVCGVGADFPCKTEQIHWKPKSGRRYKCLECPDCPAGSQPSVPCGSSVAYATPVDCVFCQLGKTFSNKYGKFQCEACAVCSQGKVVKKNCTLSSNRECDDNKCIEGYYRAPFIFDCLPCTECCNDSKDEIAKECASYGKKCKVRTSPCQSSTPTTPSEITTHSPKTSTDLQTTRPEMSPSKITKLKIELMKRPTSTIVSHPVQPTWSKNTEARRGKTVKAVEEDKGNQTLVILSMILVIAAVLAISALIAVIIRLFPHNSFRCRRWNGNSNIVANVGDVVSSNLNRPASASQEQLNPDDTTLAQIESKHQVVFDRMCLNLDNGRWLFRRDYERLAAKYGRIPLEVRNALRDEVQRDGGSPSKLLMSHLQASYPNLPLRHLVGKLKEIGRNDLAQILRPYVRQNISHTPPSDP